MSREQDDRPDLPAAAGVSIIGTDLSGVITAFSSGAERMLGYRAEELVGVHTVALLHDQDELAERAEQLGIAPGIEVIWDGTRHGAGETAACTYVHKDGSRVPVELTVTTELDDSRRPRGFISVAVDISDRERMESELRMAAEEAETLGTAFTHAPGGVALIALDGRFIRVNAALCGILGRSESEIVGHTSEAFTHPDDLVVTADAIDALRAAGSQVLAEKRYVRPDGQIVSVSTTGTAIQARDGHVTHIIAHFRDVSEQRLAQEQLRAAEEQFRRSFDDAPIGMTIGDLTGRYLQVNDAFCTILGHPRTTLVGLTRQSITHPDDLATDDEDTAGLLAGRVKSLTREKRYLHASGHPIWASVHITMVRDAENRPHHIITQVQDITERREYEDQLKHLADHDPLTGLLNRRSFQRELDSHVARVKRFGAIGAVLMLDLDHFKYYNDTKGHSAGDELIIRIAQTLQGRLRETDVIARLGGDEFAILLPRENRESAEIVAQVLVKLVREQAPKPTLGEQRRVTASIGIACFADGDDLRAEEIMVNADLAMYDAKENGRNGSAQYSTEQHGRPRIESRIKWGSEITQALAEDRFELLAQPITPLHDSGPTQYELLLRMRDAHGDQIPPGTFLYVAERLGLVQEIDRWVVAHAIDMLAAERAAGHDLRFEVNLSGHSIGTPLLLELIERRLQETEVPPDRLIFEITETAAVADIARAAAFAERLSELGCKFALDDFGAGFGSFYYLKHLPFDYLKIDGEYVRHCATNKTDRILIAAVVQIARDMGKLTIAEFVGDQESVEVLRDLGVDYGQGYFLGRPAPLTEHLAAREASSAPQHPAVAR